MVSLITNIPDDVGFGEVTDDELVEVEEAQQEISFETENGTLTPVHIKTYGGDSYGKHTTLNDGCKNTETRNGGATGFQITVEGILTLEQLRKAREIGLHKGEPVTISMQPWVEEYICNDFTWDKPNDLNEWVSSEYPEGTPAFTFQLQTKDMSSNNQ